MSEPITTADSNPESPEDEWRTLESEPLPNPSVAPFFTALGVTLLLWGLITSKIILAVGLPILFTSLFLWIKEIKPSREDHE